jgi:hypothetical protein
VIRRIDPMLAVVIGVAVGIVVTVAAPRTGMCIAAAAAGIGALLRLVLRPTAAGLLVVRSRRVDVAVLGFFAVALLVLALVTPIKASA